MALVSCILIWNDGKSLCSRLTTNVSKKRLLARLADQGILESVAEIHAFFGDRVEGGNGYDLVWKDHVRRENLPAILGRL